MPPAHLGSMDVQIAASAASVGLGPQDISALPRLLPPEGDIVHDVILVPYRQQTLLFAHYLSVLIPPYGFMVGAPLPPLTPGLQAVMPLVQRTAGPRTTYR